MSLFTQRSINFLGADQLIPRRSALALNNNRVSVEDALRTSTVWACLRLRADLVSTMPVDVYRTVDGRQFEMKPPPVLVNPSGASGGMQEWLYSSQVDLDRFGNFYGMITARDGAGRPSRIEPLLASSVSLRGKGETITEYQVAGKSYDPFDIWHERQFTVAGVPVGLSPITYGALSINQHLNAQEFVTSWFGGSAIPKSRLGNKSKRVDQAEAEKIRDRYQAMVTNGGLFVHGSDWEFDTIQATAADGSFIDAMGSSNADICRFFGVPGDLVDVQTSTGRATITYANITQRNLQLLILNLGPVVARREYALSGLTSAPRYVKLNADAIVLRMDPATRSELLVSQVAGRLLAPSEAREIDDRPPFTEGQMAEFDRLFGANVAPEPPAPTIGVPA